MLKTKQTILRVITAFFLGLGLSYPTSDVIEKIRQLFKTREQRLLPVPWLEDFSFHMNDIFTRLKIVGRDKTQGVLNDDITDMTAIFMPIKEKENGEWKEKKPRTVLIEGDPGMGKTTYCQKLAYDWATKQNEWDPSFPEIEVLLLLKCHEIRSDIWEAIDDQILPEEMDTQAKECFFKFIRENQSKVLLVLDGLDEADPRNLKMFYNLIEGKQLSGCYIVLTSRHEAGRSARRYCDTLWEIVGFTREDAESFIHKYFKNVGKEHLAWKLIAKVWHEAGDLLELIKNPLNTALLCVICEDFEGVFPTRRTQLYTEIVLFVLRRYEQKKGLSSKNEDLLTVYKEDLLHLGEMALQSLRRRELYLEENKSGGRFIVSSKFGFLSLQPPGSKRTVRVRYAFLHKSFQEFFSGFYLACKLIEGDIDFQSVVTDQRYEDELYQVSLFTIGILASTSMKTAESFVKSMAENINLKNPESFGVSKSLFFALDLLSEYKSLVCTLGRHLNFTHLEISRKHIGHAGAHNWSKSVSDYKAASLLSRPITSFCLYVPRIVNARAASFSQALAVNSSLTNLKYCIDDSLGVAFLYEAIRVNAFLTSLDLSGNSIGDSGAASLSQALAVNSSLTNLDLSWNSICSSGAASLSEALAVNSSLTNLDLRRNSIGDSGAASLSQALAVNSSLTNLDLSWNSIGSSGAASLSEALAVNPSLTNLHLRANSIGSSGAASLFKALAVNSSLTNLQLRDNRIGESGGASLFQAFAINAPLATLNLSGNHISESALASLSQALRVNTSLTNLDLSGNPTGKSGAASLSQAIVVNTSLTNLDLSWNRISNSGAASLSQALAVNSSLTNLDLRGNSIGESGAVSLSSALAVNSSLTNLDLSKNSIGSSGAKSLSQALAVNSSLTNLYLRGNSIGESGAVSLFHALAVNSSLANLDLSWNSIRTGVASLPQALAVNASLTTLDLSGNHISESAAASLSQALAVNASLTNLSWNRISNFILRRNSKRASGAASLSTNAQSSPP